MASRQQLVSSVVQAVISSVVVLVILLVLRFVLGYIPVIRQLQLPATTISLATLIAGGFTLGIVGIAATLAFDADRLVHAYAGRFPEAGEIARFSVLTACAIFAYGALRAPLLPLLEGYAWIYHLCFLPVIFYPLSRGLKALYSNRDKLASATTRRLGLPADNDQEASCASCGNPVAKDARFCAKCGTPVAGASSLVSAEQRADQDPGT